MKEPTGAVWRWSYDHLGRALSRTDPLGAVTRAVYTDAGRPVASYDALGGVTRTTFDGLWRLTELTDPQGRTTRFRWGGHNNHCETIYPDGHSVRQRYDREGALVEQFNEKGENHRRVVDPRGLCVEEETFDGRKLYYRYDAVGRLIRSTDSKGAVTELAYSLAGDLLSRTFDDGTQETYEYNVRGDLVGVMAPGYSIEVERDAVGNVVREAQTVAGVTHVVYSEYDLMDQRVARRSTLGHSLELLLDARRRPVQARLDGRFDVSITRDALDREILRRLPGGAEIRHEVDPLTRLAGTALLRPTPPPAGQPDWLGTSPGMVFQRRYDYSPAGELVAAVDSRTGTTRYEYDARSRLLGFQPDRSPGERFRYDPASNHESIGGERRVLGAGNRLFEKGRTRYVWNDDGRLIEKHVPSDAGDLVWKYTWTPRGELQSVTRPDGVLFEMTYDAFARRLSRRVSATTTDGRRLERSFTRFVWDGPTLLHELRTAAAEEGDPIVEERTYWIEDPESCRVSAHRDGGPGSEWTHYLNDVSHAPIALVDDGGSVLCDIEHTAWGTFKSSGGALTPAGFAGQYMDEEIGLAYNRHRYYDPDSGRYISPDPVGLYGDLNAYRYCTNPVGWIDPLGLHNAQATLYPAGGGAGRSVINPATGTRNFPNVPGDRDQDSERLILNALQGQPNLAGSTLVIQGDCHSCPGCQQAMEDFARANNMRIMYQRHDSDLIFNADFRPGGSGTSNRAQYEAGRQARIRAATRR